MTFLLQLREAAKGCSRPEMRTLLRDCADNIESALKASYDDPTEENLIWLNGAWAYATRVMKNVPPEAGPTPPRSITEEMKLAA